MREHTNADHTENSQEFTIHVLHNLVRNQSDPEGKRYDNDTWNVRIVESQLSYKMYNPLGTHDLFDVFTMHFQKSMDNHDMEGFFGIFLIYSKSLLKELGIVLKHKKWKFHH